ncbi:MAG: subtilisin-like proprotein convertase family protein [Kiritimatiellia bacterium]|jgi:subtilisin-like proprotein convertase family protein
MPKRLNEHRMMRLFIQRSDMPRLMKIGMLGFLLAHGIASVHAAENWWQPAGAALARAVAPEAPWIRPAHGAVLKLDAARMETALRDVVEQGASVRVMLPIGKGAFATFALEAVSIMAPELARKYPDILTVHGEAIDQPGSWARLDWTPQGFHGLIQTPDGLLYIDPWTRGDTAMYACYLRDGFVREAQTSDIQCARIPAPEMRQFQDAPAYLKKSARGTATTQLRTYRLAVTADHEFTEFHGGEAAALAAIVTGLNRINTIYERDLGLRMELVANNDLLIFNATNDPHTGSFRATSIIGTRIGLTAFDIGHYVSGRNSGSLSALRVVCKIAEKGDGKSASSMPNNDPYWVDIVAHEIGHQFGADHTFNSVTSACGGGNRAAATAYEPGSGSTIMAYAGICGADNVQSVSDDYFHASSIDEILSYIAGSGNCASLSSTANHAPVADAGADYIIPARTPFVLTGSGSDVDNDTLQYTWEQFDLGPAQVLGAADNGQSPLFRSLPPAADPIRTLPDLSTLLSGFNDPSERLPSTSRTLHFRFTARDNRTGGVAGDDMTVQVVDTGAPFGIISPNTAVTLSGSHTVVWNPGGSAAAPINANLIRILLSVDGGATYPFVLSESTANDGSETVALPPLTTQFARMRIEAINHIFFDVSGANFTLTPGGTSVAFFEHEDAPALNDAFGNGNSNGRFDPGEGYVLFHPVLRNIGTFGGTNIQASLTAVSPGLTILHDVSAYTNLSTGAAGASIDPFILSLDETHPCGEPVVLRMTVLTDQGGNDVTIRLPSGIGSGGQTVSYSSYAAVVPSVAIPDNVPAGTNITFQASGLTTNTSKILFRIGGNACTTNAGDIGNGIAHNYLHDLKITLTSPEGTTITLMQQAGVGIDAGPNMCSVVFDDSAFTSIQNIPDDGGPHVGTYQPMQALSAFIGEDPNGVWTANVSDLEAGEVGSIHELLLTIEAVTDCTAPVPTSNPDGDGDGMPDEWERFHFNNPTSTVATVDHDLDGADALSEYLADTDPTDDQSFFAIDAFSSGTGLDFMSRFTRDYRLQSVDLLSGTNWMNEAMMNGTGDLINFPITPGPDLRFYRVRAEVP